MEVTNELIFKYEKLAHAVCQKYTCFEDYEDMVQMARLGIWHGLEKYDETSGTSLLGYLYGCAKREVGKYMVSKFTYKREYYHNYHKVEKGTIATISLNKVKEEIEGDKFRVGDTTGKDDDDINKIIIEDAVQKSLDTMFNVDFKHTHQKTKDFYVDYLKLARDVGSDRIIPILQKKYPYTRQRAHSIIDKYNKRMRELLSECL